MYEPGTGLTVQVHDFNPGIAASGLFWTVRIPDRALGVKKKRARLRIRNLELVDSFTIFGPTEVSAEVSFDIKWKASGGRRRITPGSSDPTDPTNFKALLRDAIATGSFSGSNEDGFSFEATMASSEGIFGEMGFEKNGVFLNRDSDDGDDDDDKDDDDDDDDKDDDDDDKDDDDKDDDDA